MSPPALNQSTARQHRNPGDPAAPLQGRFIERPSHDRISLFISHRGHRNHDRRSRPATGQTLQHRALRGDRRGILATRHGAGLYTLELNEAVPYGLTLEQSA
jgi:hypothetical protein